MASKASYYVLLLTTLATYFLASKRIFDEVYETTHIVIDELFHIPQGMAYCNRNFTYWDPKITTLPGLYLTSAAFLGTKFPCSTYNLRFINFIASCINFLLFASIFNYVYSRDVQWKNIVQALNLTLLPPLYFFSHIYYTDTLSLTFLLFFSRFTFESKHKMLLLILGAACVLMRQTNIVWIVLVFGQKVINILIKSSRVFGNEYLVNYSLSKQSSIAKNVDSSKLKRYYGFSDFMISLKYHVTTGFINFFKFLTFSDFSVLFVHGTVMVGFVVFVYLNGSIVVGDKKAHEASLHIPQLFYFLVFYGFFGLPHVLAKIKETLQLMWRKKLLVIFAGFIFALIVHFNTVVHPYLLADNRHYTFYIWNRWYGKYDFAVYASVPVYIFLLFNLYCNIKDHNCISFLVPYTICLFFVLALQKMIEVRYFLIPYIILRLRFNPISFRMVLVEFVWYILLNIVTFYLFFNKEIIWRDFDYVQRIIW